MEEVDWGAKGCLGGGVGFRGLRYGGEVKTEG